MQTQFRLHLSLGACRLLGQVMKTEFPSMRTWLLVPGVQLEVEGELEQWEKLEPIALFEFPTGNHPYFIGP